MYDFNLNIGDTLPPSYNYGSNNSVIGIDSTLVGNNYHKRFLLKSLSAPSSQDSSYALIEGIGSTYGLYNSIVPPFESGSQLNCFGHNGKNYPTNSNCILTVGIHEANDENRNFKIFPNPSPGIFTINSSDPSTLLRVTTIEVYDVFGREIFQSTNLSQATTLDLTSYPKGIYFVRGNANDKMFSRKIILQ